MQHRLLFVTGDTMSPRTLEFLKSSGLPYLAKPFLVEELKEAVRQALGRRADRRRNGAVAGACARRRATCDEEGTMNFDEPNHFHYQRRSCHGAGMHRGTCRFRRPLPDAGCRARLSRRATEIRTHAARSRVSGRIRDRLRARRRDAGIRRGVAHRNSARRRGGGAGKASATWRF